MEILDNNKISLTLIQNLETQNYIKHINVIHHHVYRLVKNAKLEIKWIFSSLMLANSLTKAFFAGFFKRHQDK